MNETLLREFMREFDDSLYPAGLLEWYELLECLSHNEQGETMLARDRITGEKAVVKCYPGSSSTGEREALLLQSLHHPGVPRFLGEFSSPAMRCVVRAYVEGRPLSAPELREGLSRERVVEIGVALCDILLSLHGQEPPIIHRDVKPQNVILSDDGRITLIDFGISRAYDPAAENDTVSFGTRKFASPEQYGFKQTDARSDLYSLGAVLMYLLCGAVEPQKIQALVPDRELAGVIGRCMAFSPDDRYASAADVKKALLAINPQVRRKKRVRAAHLYALAIVALALGAVIAVTRLSVPAAYAFQEPQIERGVRLMLGLAESAPISADALASVDALYLIGDECCADKEQYYARLGDWYAENAARGSVSTLEDLRQMPNLRTVCIGAQRITDLSPLEALANLETAELRANSIEDIAPLGNHALLYSVGLNGNPVKDLSPLSTCPCLKILDLCDASAYDSAALAALGGNAFDFLDISNRTDSWKHLGSMNITHLKLGYTGLDSLQRLDGVQGLQTLEINGTLLRNLDGLEKHRELRYVRLSNLNVQDFSPVLALPNLEKVAVSHSMEEAFRRAAGQAKFEIVVE